MNYIEQFMKDNDIKIDEEFYVIDDKGEKIKHSYYDERFMKFRFTESFKFISELSNLDCSYYFSCLMSGKCRIEKIPHKPKSVWELTEEDMYYCIHNGDISQYLFDSDTDKDIRDLGNAFLTREEAELEVERRKCEAILLKYGTRDMMSLANYLTDKFYIIYNNYDNLIEIESKQFTHTQGTIYFKSKELARKAIDEVTEERLKKYVFNVKVPEFLNKKMNLKE